MASKLEREAASIKRKLDALLGGMKDAYNQLLRDWFQKKCSNDVFKLVMVNILSPEMVGYHNLYLSAILTQAETDTSVDPNNSPELEDKGCDSRQQVLAGRSYALCMGFARKPKIKESQQGQGEKKPHKIAGTHMKKSGVKDKVLEEASEKPKCNEISVEPTYVCKICDESFRYKWNLRIHVKKLHTSDDKAACEVPCYICRKVFPGRDLKEKHFQSVHMPLIRRCFNVKKDPNLSFECEFCKKRFLLKRSLMLHMEKHSDPPNPSLVDVETDINEKVVNIQENKGSEVTVEDEDTGLHFQKLEVAFVHPKGN